MKARTLPARFAACYSRRNRIYQEIHAKKVDKPLAMKPENKYLSK